MGELEPISADSGQEARYILDKSPIYHRVNAESQTTIHSDVAMKLRIQMSSLLEALFNTVHASSP